MRASCGGSRPTKNTIQVHPLQGKYYKLLRIEFWQFLLQFIKLYVN